MWLMVYLTDSLRAPKSLWFGCKTNDKTLITLKTLKKQICRIVTCCKSWWCIPINSAVGSLVIISLMTLIWHSSAHGIFCMHLHEITTYWWQFGYRQCFETYASCISLKINLLSLLKWKAFQSPTRIKSIVSKNGKSLSRCLKHNASRWFLQFYINCMGK